jgi:hypothetical protein
MQILFLLAHLVAAGPTFQVPYNPAATNHILLRAKLNGLGPYNFIMDTGAPALFVAEDIAKKLSILPDAKHWGVVRRLEIEGGPVVEKIAARVEGPFQLQAMNQLALTGVEIHGVIGYNVLARFRIEIDMTKPEMVWTRLAGEPPPPASVTEAQRKKMVRPAQNQKQMESMAKMASTMFARKPTEVLPRGFFGIELESASAGAIVKRVLPGGPAAQSGILAGDVVTSCSIGGQTAAPVSSSAALVELLKGMAPDEAVTLTVKRDGTPRTFTIRAAKGGL